MATPLNTSGGNAVNGDFSARFSALNVVGAHVSHPHHQIAPHQLFDDSSTIPSLLTGGSFGAITTAGTSTPEPADSGRSRVAAITEISKDEYSIMKSARNRPEGMQLSEPVEHPERGVIYYLVSKGFGVRLYYKPATKKQPLRDFVYAIPNLLAIRGDKKSAAIGAGLEKVGSAVKKSFQLKKFAPQSQYIKFVVAGLATYLPNISGVAMEIVFPFVLHTYFELAGIDVEMETLRLLSPSRTTFDNYIRDFAAYQFLLAAVCIERAGFYSLSFDKGDAAKGKMGGCVKLVGWTAADLKTAKFLDGQVQVFTLDADKTGGSSEEVAAGIQFSMAKLCLDEEHPPKCKSFTTDSGGGGTVESAHRPLVRRRVIQNRTLVCNCSLHDINLEQRVPITKVLLAGTMNRQKGSKHDDRDVEQLIYSCYAWEREVGKDIMKEYWNVIVEHVSDLPDDADNDDYDDGGDVAEMEIVATICAHGRAYIGAKRGSDCRWWTLGEAATVLWNTLPMRVSLAENYDKQKIPGKARDTCQTFLSLAKEKTIICDLALVKCHHRFYIARHMKFLQTPDTLVLKAGFQAFSIFVRSFLMRQDYQSMISDYGSIPEFSDLVKALGEIPTSDPTRVDPTRVKADQKISEFFLVGLQEHKKMFHRWVAMEAIGLAFLASYSEAPTGRLVAQRILGTPLCANPQKTRYINGVWSYPEGERTYGKCL
jgi:hypothetical protein